MTENQPKPTSTADLAIAILKFLQEVWGVVAVLLLGRARAKQRQAEDRTAVAETELEVVRATAEVEKANAKKDPADIIDNFLANK